MGIALKILATMEEAVATVNIHQAIQLGDMNRHLVHIHLQATIMAATAIAVVIYAIPNIALAALVNIVAILILLLIPK